ncbi:MAG TPA: hypothetical protein VI702_05720 [Nitrospiria bacterium]
MLIQGCGPIRMYSGPARPPEQVAILEIGNVKLFSLDSLPVGKDGHWKLEILPGEHDLRASHNMSGFGEEVFTYTFSAEPGHRYLFDMDYKTVRTLYYRPWVKDLTTGNIVGRKN